MWLVSIIMMAACIFSKQSIDVNAMFITSGLFAVAGSISMLAQYSKDKR